MAKLLKSLITVIFIMIWAVQALKAQTRAEIIKHRIYRVDRTSFGETFSIYYDKKGNIIKETGTHPFTKTKSVTLFRYKDTMLVQTTDSIFERNEFVEVATIDYVYEYDAQNRLRSATTFSGDSVLLKETYTYNSQNQVDTVFMHNVTIKPGKARISHYTDSGWVITQNCDYPLADYGWNCRIEESFTSDTLEIKIEKFPGRYGCLVDSAATIWVTKTYKKDGEVYRFETNVGGEQKISYRYKRNRLGLVSEILKDTWRAGDNPMASVTRVKYYYRK